VSGTRPVPSLRWTEPELLYICLGVRHANIGITLDMYSHVLPGMQEAAAEKFDRLFDDGDAGPIPNGDVIKMVSNEGEVASRPCGIRTHDTLIKRFKRHVPEGARE